MESVAIVLVGIGGYGGSYIRWFNDNDITPEQGKIIAVVDPTAHLSPNIEWVKAKGLPIYNSLDDMYREHKPQLVIVSSPTQFHKEQAKTALANGSHVLCEKPLVPIAQEAQELIDAEAASGGYELGVGFQWSFSPTMLRLKKDILAGKYGNPVMIKTFVSWPRAHAYYESSAWKGKILSDKGEPILDSILANATAHYLHNIYFMLGDALETSDCPTGFDVELYRANDIESFDTAILRGDFASGAQFYYSASHSVAENHSPTFVYEFENGTISFNHWEEDDIVRGELKSGEVTEYGNPFSAAETSAKVAAMIDNINKGTAVVCTPKTALPHLLTSNSLFDYGTIVDFPKDIVKEIAIDGKNLGNYVESLYATLRDCFEVAKLPNEAGVAWSKPASKISLEGYKGFTGRQVEGYRK